MNFCLKDFLFTRNIDKFILDKYGDLQIFFGETDKLKLEHMTISKDELRELELFHISPPEI